MRNGGMRGKCTALAIECQRCGSSHQVIYPLPFWSVTQISTLLNPHKPVFSKRLTGLHTPRFIIGRYRPLQTIHGCNRHPQPNRPPHHRTSRQRPSETVTGRNGEDRRSPCRSAVDLRASDAGRIPRVVGIAAKMAANASRSVKPTDDWPVGRVIISAGGS